MGLWECTSLWFIWRKLCWMQFVIYESILFAATCGMLLLPTPFLFLGKFDHSKSRTGIAENILFVVSFIFKQAIFFKGQHFGSQLTKAFITLVCNCSCSLTYKCDLAVTSCLRSTLSSLQEHCATFSIEHETGGGSFKINTFWMQTTLSFDKLPQWLQFLLCSYSGRLHGCLSWLLGNRQVFYRMLCGVLKIPNGTILPGWPYQEAAWSWGFGQLILKGLDFFYLQYHSVWAPG